MELLNPRVINSDSFELFKIMIKKIYIKENNSKSIISYNEFKEAIVSFVEGIMKSYLEDTEYYKDKYSCIVKKLPTYRRGEFNSKNNIITINEAVIQDIYLGNIDSMITIFHELNHFKSKYDIRLGKVNNDIIRTIKEDLLRVANRCLFKFNKDNLFIDDDYYKCNYTVFSDEKIAEINTINNLMFFIQIVDIELSEQHLQQLKERITNNTIQYNNYLRDLRLIFNYNNNFLDFEEAFDIMIKRNPDWLAIPQLSIEYYLNRNGKVAKRTKEELEERLKTESDEDIKKYIYYLLTPNNSKRLSKSEFPQDIKKFKMNELGYIPINSNRNTGFKRK